jgi:hypothetical protein
MTEAAATLTLTLATRHFPGGGGIEGGLEVIVGGDDVDEELLQLHLPLPLCRHLGLLAAALLDRLEDAGESLVGDEVLRANP